MKFKKKILVSLILMLSIFMLNSAPVFSAEVNDIDADAQSNVDAQFNVEAISDSDFTNITTDVATLNIHSLNKNECMIAEYVNADDFNKSSHVSRLADEEKLDTYVFLNADGTKSVYYMDEKVKFVDKNGDVKEKDISLVSKSDGYGITRNEFDLHLPTNASSGITMSYNGYDVKIIPQTTVKAVPAKIENGSVVYDGFFGTDTSLKYTPALSGLKEDVIMKAYVPNTSFSFILDTDGLELYNKDGEYYLAENESSKAVLNLGKVIIYDAMGKPEYGTMTVTTITKGQKYKLSLSAPEDFLKDPTTVYPVTIDPSLTVSDNDTGNGAIADTVLYSNRPNINYGGARYLQIGYVDSTYGVGRVAVKLPGLYNSAEYINIDSSCITSVKFYCWDNSDNSAQQVNLYRLSGVAWEENTVTGNMNMSYYTTPNMGTTMSSDTWTAFDITALAKAWKTVPGVVPGLGFILVNSNESSSTNMKKICSSEFSNPDLRPYVVMRYGVRMNLSFVNYYDSSFAVNTNLIQYIDLAYTFSNYVYSTYFSLGIIKDGTPVERTTVINECTQGSNSPCNNMCGTDCRTSHHKNARKISNQLYNEPRESDHIYVLWTNRDFGTYCTDTNGIHETVNWLGVVYGKRPVIHFLHVYNTSNLQKACMSITLVHEAAHSLGMEEVYNEVGHDHENETHCVMERFDTSNAYAFYQDVLNGIEYPFCSSCEESMLSHTSNISISGNLGGLL